MKLKKSLSIILLVGSLVAIPNCFNFSVRAVNTENDNVNDVNSVQESLVENDGFATPVPHANVEEIKRAMNSVRAVGPQLHAYYNRIRNLVKVIGDDGDVSKKKVHNDCMEEQLEMGFNITPQYEQSCYNNFKEYHLKLVASFFRIDESEITSQNKKDFLDICNIFLEVEKNRIDHIVEVKKNGIDYIMFKQPEGNRREREYDDCNEINKRLKF